MWDIKETQIYFKVGVIAYGKKFNSKALKSFQKHIEFSGFIQHILNGDFHYLHKISFSAVYNMPGLFS